MKNRFKVSIWFIVALVISFLVSAGSILANSAHVEPKERCYKFIADGQPDPPKCKKPKSTIWLIKSPGGLEKPCAVRVWAKDGNKLTCKDITKISDEQGIESEHYVPGQDLVESGISGPEEGTKLSNAITNDSVCDEMWLRFVDENGCNRRCFISRGKLFCY